jgi:hypothetical protein
LFKDKEMHKEVRGVKQKSEFRQILDSVLAAGVNRPLA